MSRASATEALVPLLSSQHSVSQYEGCDGRTRNKEFRDQTAVPIATVSAPYFNQITNKDDTPWFCKADIVETILSYCISLPESGSKKKEWSWPFQIRLVSKLFQNLLESHSLFKPIVQQVCLRELKEIKRDLVRDAYLNSGDPNYDPRCSLLLDKVFHGLQANQTTFPADSDLLGTMMKEFDVALSKTLRYSRAIRADLVVASVTVFLLMLGGTLGGGFCDKYCAIDGSALWAILACIEVAVILLSCYCRCVPVLNRSERWSGLNSVMQRTFAAPDEAGHMPKEEKGGSAAFFRAADAPAVIRIPGVTNDDRHEGASLA